MNVYPFIEAEKQGDHNVKRACELLAVSRSAYYADRASGSSVREQRDAELTGKIAAIHDDSRHTYGSPRVHHELQSQGERCSRKRVARLMRAAGRYGRTPRRWKTTTIADPAAAHRPDLIGREFAIDPGQPAALDTRWCGDITYIHTWEGWLYLATVIDLASRRVVGWATADHLRTDLVADALTDAVNRRRPAGSVVFHSDRGCQYTSTQYANLARDLGVTLSDARANAGTTRLPNPSSPPSKPSSFTATPGRPARPPPARSSTTSRAGTTPADATPPSATAAPPPTNQPTQPTNR